MLLCNLDAVPNEAATATRHRDPTTPFPFLSPSPPPFPLSSPASPSSLVECAELLHFLMFAWLLGQGVGGLLGNREREGELRG